MKILKIALLIIVSTVLLSGVCSANKIKTWKDDFNGEIWEKIELSSGPMSYLLEREQKNGDYRLSLYYESGIGSIVKSAAFKPVAYINIDGAISDMPLIETQTQSTMLGYVVIGRYSLSPELVEKIRAGKDIKIRSIFDYNAETVTYDINVNKGVKDWHLLLDKYPAAIKEDTVPVAVTTSPAPAVTE